MRSVVVRGVVGSVALLGLLGAAWLSAVAAPASGPDFAAIDSYVSKSLAGTPGFALSIVHGDQVVHVKGFGVADANGSPVTGDTPFALGSEAKSFTALGIMQLKESGALDLDSPVQRYLPWFLVADPNYSRQITVRQLLNQTSGLPDSAPLETPVTNLESRVRDLATVELLAAPGRAFNYSNSNYQTLGLVIEAVCGQSYADYMQQHVFTPLGMAHSAASESEAKRDGLATAHEWWFGLPVASDNFRTDAIPAGWVVSSPADMSHYLIAQLNGGSYAGAQVLSAQGVAAMHRGVAEDDNNGTYGMGWYASSINGVSDVYHPGDSGLIGHSDMILVPSEGWGVQLVANASSMTTNLSPPVNSTAEGVISMLMGSAPPFTPSPLDIYIVFDLFLAALIAFQLWSLLRILRKPVQPARAGVVWVLRRLIAPLAWRLALASAASGVLFVFLTGMFGASPLLVAETDLGSPVIAISGLLLINGGLRTVWAYRSMHSRYAVVATVSAQVALHEAAS
jgi:CubicO group peptidase (beta-lactamase class C family)